MKFSSIRKPYTYACVSDTTIAVQKFLAYESQQMLEYEIFTRTKFSAITVDTGGATPMLKGPSLFERCMTLPVSKWSVARKQSIRSVGGHVRNLTTSYFKRKETKFVGNKTAIHGRNRSYLCLLFVKLARLCDFSSFIRPITYARASREHAFDASGSAKPEPQQRRQ